MTKKLLSPKLCLKRETIANLTYEEMRTSLGGAEPTKQGNTCKTDEVCCVLPVPNPRNNYNGNAAFNRSFNNCDI